VIILATIWKEDNGYFEKCKGRLVVRGDGVKKTGIDDFEDAFSSVPHESATSPRLGFTRGELLPGDACADARPPARMACTCF
jgi:hypothetical protein